MVPVDPEHLPPTPQLEPPQEGTVGSIITTGAQGAAQAAGRPDIALLIGVLGSIGGMFWNRKKRQE